MTAVRGVIFDLFHTLTGPESGWSEIPPTREILGIDRRAWDEALNVHSRWRLVGEERDPYQILRRLATHVNPSIPDALVRKAVELRIQRFRDTLERIPQENLEAIRSLRGSGLRVGLISNADVLEVASWPGCPAAAVFDTAVFSCHVGMAKPEHAIYRKCLADMDLRAEECVFVGDGSSNELVGAKEVGLTTVFISGIIEELWPERISQRRAGADHHIVKLPEVLKLPGLIA